MKNNLWTACEFLFKWNTLISAKYHKKILPFHHMKYSGFYFSTRDQYVRTARDLRQLLAQSFHLCVSKYYSAQVTLADQRQHPESSCSPEGAPCPEWLPQRSLGAISILTLFTSTAETFLNYGPIQLKVHKKCFVFFFINVKCNQISNFKQLITQKH